MDYRPNIDAVTWFAADILPMIRRTLPAARFCIVGSNPAAEVRCLADQPGITVTGRVPDVRPYLAHATACVAPLRIARGIQNKVLEAMAMARPVVLTSGALEGIHAMPQQEVLLADTPAGFAEACCRLVKAETAGAIGAAARARVIADHDWDAALRPLNRLLRPAASPLLTEPA
jgi:glycosyltransferase involved in cell wall biosynthesis